MMDTLFASLGEAFAKLAGKHRTLFYAAFAAVYDMRYGLESGLTRGDQNPMPKGWAAEIIDRLFMIERAHAPEPVLDATARRTTHKGERLLLARYLGTGRLETGVS